MCFFLNMFLGFVDVLFDYFFSMRKWIFIFTSFFLLIQALRKPEVEIGLY